MRGTSRHKAPRFAWKPTQQPRETAASFLSRLAHMNGRTFADLRTEVGIDPYGIETGRVDAMRALARLCGIGHGGLARWTPSGDTDRGWSLHGQRMGVETLERTVVRVCPSCILADLATAGEVGPYQRAEWLLRPIRTCTTHASPLVRVDPIRRRFEPYDVTATVLAAALELDRARPDAGTTPPTTFETWLLDRLVGKRTFACWLDDMPFQVAATLCEATGAVATFGHKVRRSLLTGDEARRAGAAGFEAIHGDREAFVRTLGEIHSHRGGKGVWGARASIGNLYPLLERMHADPDWSLPVDVAREFLLASVPFEPDDELFGQKVGERRIHTVRSAVRASGTHSRTIRKILRRAAIVDQTVLASARDHHVTIPSSDVADMLTALRSSLTVPQVIERFGIPRLHLRHMLATRRIESATASVGVPWAKHRISLAAMEAFMKNLFDRAEEVEVAPTGFHDMKGARQCLNATTEEVLDLVLGDAGLRKARLSGRHDYGALLVDVPYLRPRVALPKGVGLTQRDAARHMGVAVRCVKSLVEDGLLDVVTERNSVNRSLQRMVAPESAERFRSAFVSLFELAATHGRHHMQLKAELTSRGLSPSFDAARYHASLYSRPDVEAALGNPATG